MRSKLEYVFRRVTWRVRQPAAWAQQLALRSIARLYGAEIGEHCYLARGTRLSGKTVLGRGVMINGPAIFKGTDRISVGNYCAIGGGVRLISSNHRTDLPNMNLALHQRLGWGEGVDHLDESRGPIQVGPGAWIGDGAIVLSGVAIGTGAVIGAGSVVSKDIPPFSVAVGNPARVIRMRMGPVDVERAEASRWWDLPEDEMRPEMLGFVSQA